MQGLGLWTWGFDEGGGAEANSQDPNPKTQAPRHLLLRRGRLAADDFQGLLELAEAAGHFDQALDADGGRKGLLGRAVFPDEVLELLHGRNGVEELLGVVKWSVSWVRTISLPSV